MPTYIFRGEWDPNAVYELFEDQQAGIIEQVEYQGAIWNANYYSIDQNPMQYNLPPGQTTSPTGIPWSLAAGSQVNYDTVVPSWMQSYEHGLGSAVATAIPMMKAGYTDDHTVALFWQPAVVKGVGDVDHYDIYAKNNVTGVTTFAGTTSSTSFTVTGLAASTNYTFTVTASDLTGTSGTQVQTGVGYNNYTWNMNPGSGPNPTLTLSTDAPHLDSGKHFSAYLDMTLPSTDLLKISANSGLRDFSLAFMQTTVDVNGNAVLVNGAPSLSWGGIGTRATMTAGAIQSQINAVQSQGGTVTISFGGYNGLDAAVYAAANGITAAQLQAEYQAVISTYGVTHLDFDVENVPTVNNVAANNLRNQAIVGLQAANPGLHVTFTLATSANGLTATNDHSSANTTVGDNLGVIRNAIAAGVKIDVVNIMAMDYFDGHAGNNAPGGVGLNHMYTAAITAARAVNQQVNDIYTALNKPNTTKIGITPMIGQNDETGGGDFTSGVSEVFTLDDARALQAFASANSWVAGLGEWALSRDSAATTTTLGFMGYDVPNPPHNPLNPKGNISGVIQSAYEFAANLGMVEYARAKPSDFNGDTTSDILLRNTSTGDMGFDVIKNGAIQSWQPLGATSATYVVEGIGDLNGDGTSDILFRNNSNGDMGYYSMLNGVKTWHALGGSSAAYSVDAVGDFNGDGVADILFRNHTTGDFGVDQMSRAGGLPVWHSMGGSSAAYSVVGTGDFNADGVSDVLFRNNTTGDIGWDEMVSTGALPTWHAIGGSSTLYAVVGVADFNSDGVSDVLLRNSANGSTGYYQINNGTFGSWHDLGFVANGSSVVGTGDYSGDGMADILLRNNSTGAMAYDQVAGTSLGLHQLGTSSAAYTVQLA